MIEIQTPGLGSGNQTPGESSPGGQPASWWGSTGHTFPLPMPGSPASWLASETGHVTCQACCRLAFPFYHLTKSGGLWEKAHAVSGCGCFPVPFHTYVPPCVNLPECRPPAKGGKHSGLPTSLLCLLATPLHPALNHGTTLDTLGETSAYFPELGMENVRLARAGGRELSNSPHLGLHPQSPIN